MSIIQSLGSEHRSISSSRLDWATKKEGSRKKSCASEIYISTEPLLPKVCSADQQLQHDQELITKQELQDHPAKQRRNKCQLTFE
jgi:hypothetical protein